MFNRGFVLWGLVQTRTVRLSRFAPSSGLYLAALLAAVLLLPGSGWANTSKNCPVEPTQAPIVSGETYFGTNCVLNTASDQDVFTFNASAGDIWKLVVGGTNVGNPNNVCETLRDAKGNTVTSACSDTNFTHSATIITTLTVAGTYSVVVSETSTAVVDYGISVERLSPAPSDAAALVLGKTVSSEVNPPSAQDAYTFFGTTTGNYLVSATMTSGGNPENLCFSVYQPGGTAVVKQACTDTNFTFTVQANVTPAVNGTFVVVVFGADNFYTLNYNLSVTCVSAPGTCGTPPPVCALKDAASYDATTQTLTMNFTLATPVAATWNGWLSSQNTVQAMWSVSQPITEPAISVTKTQGSVAKSGKVGILSTLTTPTAGITCSSWQLVDTGAP